MIAGMPKIDGCIGDIVTGLPGGTCGTGGMLDKSGGTCDGVARLPGGMHDKSGGTGGIGGMSEI